MGVIGTITLRADKESTKDGWQNITDQQDDATIYGDIWRYYARYQHCREQRESTDGLVMYISRGIQPRVN